MVPDGSESALRQLISSVGHRHREDRPTPGRRPFLGGPWSCSPCRRTRPDFSSSLTVTRRTPHWVPFNRTASRLCAKIPSVASTFVKVSAYGPSRTAHIRISPQKIGSGHPSTSTTDRTIFRYRHRTSHPAKLATRCIEPDCRRRRSLLGIYTIEKPNVLPAQFSAYQKPHTHHHVRRPRCSNELLSVAVARNGLLRFGIRYRRCARMATDWPRDLSDRTASSPRSGVRHSSLRCAVPREQLSSGRTGARGTRARGDRGRSRASVRHARDTNEGAC